MCVCVYYVYMFLCIIEFYSAIKNKYGIFSGYSCRSLLKQIISDTRRETIFCHSFGPYVCIHSIMHVYKNECRGKIIRFSGRRKKLLLRGGKGGCGMNVAKRHDADV